MDELETRNNWNFDSSNSFGGGKRETIDTKGGFYINISHASSDPRGLCTLGLGQVHHISQFSIASLR